MKSGATIDPYLLVQLMNTVLLMEPETQSSTKFFNSGRKLLQGRLCHKLCEDANASALVRSAPCSQSLRLREEQHLSVLSAVACDIQIPSFCPSYALEGLSASCHLCSTSGSQQRVGCFLIERSCILSGLPVRSPAGRRCATCQPAVPLIGRTGRMRCTAEYLEPAIFTFC